MLQYKFTRIEPQLDPVTKNVLSFVVGLELRDSDRESLMAYAEGIYKIRLASQRQPLSYWTEGKVRSMAMSFAIGQDWYNVLKKRVDAMRERPEPGTSFVI